VGSRLASGRPIIAEMPREHPKGCNQNALSLLLSHRPATPALPHRPLADAPLQTDDVPDTRARRARDTSQRPHHLVDAPSCIELALAQIWLAPGAR
jgi:hypothetical protein